MQKLYSEYHYFDNNGKEHWEDNSVMRVDPRYLCVSVEHTNYEPLHFDEVQARIDKRWEETGYTGPVNAWGNGSGPG
jgi:hypothetical protein